MEIVEKMIQPARVAEVERVGKVLVWDAAVVAAAQVWDREAYVSVPTAERLFNINRDSLVRR